VRVWTEPSLAAVTVLKQAWNSHHLTCAQPVKLQALAVQLHVSTTSLQAVAVLMQVWKEPVLAAATVRQQAWNLHHLAFAQQAKL